MQDETSSEEELTFASQTGTPPPKRDREGISVAVRELGIITSHGRWRR